MKKLLSMILVGLIGLTLSASELIRDVVVPAEGGLVAVPNGYRLKSVSEGVVIGEESVLNHVTLIPITIKKPGLVTITFEDGAEVFTGTPSKIMRTQIRAKVLNPEDVALSAAPGSSRLKLAGADTKVDYLILAPHDHVQLWEKFKTARAEAHPELAFAVRDLDEVYETYPLGSDGVRNYAESIHKYLRSVRDTMGFSYVILGGAWIDAAFINEQGEWTRNGNVVKTLEGTPLSIKNAVPGIIAYPRNPNEEIPSDMFYACLDLKAGQTYPWCKDESTRYYETFMNEADRKEYDSGVDVVVSRIPLKPLQFAVPHGAAILEQYKSTMQIGEDHIFTPVEIMDYLIAKLEKAESPDFSGSGRMGFSWGDFNYTKRALDASLKTENEFFDDIPNFFSTDRQTDQYGNLEMRHRDRIKDILAPNYPIIGVDGRCEHGTTWTKGLESVQAAQAQFLATDHDFNVVAMHGWAGGSAWYHVEDVYNQTGLILFNDMSFPCETGWPDFVDGKTYVSKVSCGEATVIAPFGGSIASVNNTRSGWAGGVGQLSDQHNVNSYKSFSAGSNAGETWLTAHLNFAGISAETAKEGFATSNTGGTGAWVLSEHILYGDPLVKTYALVDYAEPQATLPHVAKSVALGFSVSVSGTNAVVNATAAGDVAFTSSEGAEVARMKITNTLTVDGTAATFGEGLEGGVNRIVFGKSAGKVELDTTERFYVGGVKNAAQIVVKGDKAIIDCDNLENVGEIVFEMQPGATNILRGIKKDALAGINIKATGGTILCESSNLFGGTTVALEGTTVTLGSDPSVGKLVASGEPFNATFTGSGIIEYNHGTELLKQWTIAGNIQLKEVGSLVVGFAFSGAIGSNPTGWFTGWQGENFTDANAVLGPNGMFIRSVEEGNHHPHYPLPSKKGFTLALYADLSKVTNAKAVMLSLGHSGNFNQLLLLKDGGKIRLEVAGTLGGAAPEGCSAEVAFPGEGYHLYVIEKTEEDVKLYVDAFLPSATIAKSFDMAVGFQVGSQYGGLKAGRARAYGMAVAEIRGYDAILTQDELFALTKEFPAKTLPLAITDNVELNKEGTTAKLVNSTFGKTAYLGGSNGVLEIPEGTTVNAYGVKLNNTSRSADNVTMNVRGTLNILGTTTSAGVYMDLRNSNEIAGIMLGHYAGTSALNVYGTVNAMQADLLIGYTCSGVLTIDGGTMKLHGLTNQAGGIRNDKGSVFLKNGGTLELAAWPVKNLAQPGTMPIEIAGGTIKATGDWTCPWPITITDDTTFDANGHKISFTGAISGAGRLTITDSSNGKGAISLLGDLSGFTGALTVDAKVQNFGVAAGFEGKVGFASRPANLTLHLTTEQLTAGYMSNAWSEMGLANSQAGIAAATVIFADYSGNELQSMTGADAAKYVPSSWSSIMPYEKYGKSWSYIFIPQKGDHEYATLANWRELQTNDKRIIRNTALWTTGDAPNTTSNCGRWDATLLDVALFPEGVPEEGEFIDVHASRIEGWIPKFGLYNGVHLTIDEMFKFQGPTDQRWIVIDDKSRMTIKKLGSGAYNNVMNFSIAGEDGLVFEHKDFPGITYAYSFTGKGSVKFTKGLSGGTHQIIAADMTLSPKSNRIRTMSKKLADFGGISGAPTFTIPNTGSIRAYNADGTEDIIPTNVGNPYYVLTATSVADVGKYALFQDAKGLALYYVDYDEVETEVTITGAKTDLDLNTLKDSYTEKFVITGASGYFAKKIETVELPVEFRDTANGAVAWNWDNGYSDSSAVIFKKATGSGTITATGRATSQMIVFGIDSMFNGSIDLTGGKNRVIFGDAPTSVATAANSSITVERFGIGRIKKGGVWKADYITINGPVAIDGKATIDARLGLTIGATGAINSEASVGKVYYELFRDAVTDAAGTQAIKLYRDVWGHRLDKGETIRIIKNGCGFSIESFFPVTTTTEGDVTIYMAHEVARENAVAEINGVCYDTWDHALGAQRENGYSITVLKADELPVGYMVVDGKLVKAQVKVDDTLYATYAEALTKNEKGTVITLLENVSYDIVFTSTEDMICLDLNGFKFVRLPRVIDTYVLELVETIDAETGVVTYTAKEVVHGHNAYIDRLVDGVMVRYWYSTFEEAVSYAQDGETIVLNEDLVLNSSVDLLPSTLVDMNGHTLTTAEAGVTVSDTYHTVTVSSSGVISIGYNTYVWNGETWTKGGIESAAPSSTDRAVIPSDFGALEWTSPLDVGTLDIRCTSLNVRKAEIKAKMIVGTGTLVLEDESALVAPSLVKATVTMTAESAALVGDLDFEGRVIELAAGEIRGKLHADVRKVGSGTLTVSVAQRGEMDAEVDYEIVSGTIALAVDPLVYISFKGAGATLKLLAPADVSPYIINSTSAIIIDTQVDTTFEYDFEDYGANNAKHEFVKLGPNKLSMQATPWEIIEKVDVKEGTLEISTPWYFYTGHRFNVYPGTLVSGTGSILLGRNDYLAAPAELHMIPGGKGTIAEVSAIVAGHEASLDLFGLMKLWQGYGYINVPEGYTLRLSGYLDTAAMVGEQKYSYKRLYKKGLGTLELMRNFYFYAQMVIEEGALVRHTGSYILGGTPTLRDGATDTKVASDPTYRVTIRAAQVPGAVATMTANGVSTQTDEMGVLWGTKVVISYTAKKGYTIEGPSTFTVERAVADEMVGSELKTSMQLIDATYSLNMDGNCTTKSAILGGTALPRTGDNFSAYVEVRGSTTNKGAVPWTTNGQNGMYCNGNMIADTSAWSVLAVVELSEVEKGVIWSMGKVNADPRNGLAFIERNAGKMVELVKWYTSAQPETLLTFSVGDDKLSTSQHSYLVTFNGTNHTLFVDGKQVATTSTAYTYSMSGYQLGGVHGGAANAKLAVGAGIVIDEFGVWSGIAFNADIAKELAAKYPTYTWATVELPSELGTSVDRTKLESWATKNGVTLETVSTIKPAAFAFNCANTDAAIAQEEEAFVVTITFVNGEPVISTPEGKSYNITPTIQGRKSLTEGEWHAKEEDDLFFRAVIEL